MDYIIYRGQIKTYNKTHCPLSVIPVSPSSNPVREIGSGYPTNVYDCNRLLLPILHKSKDVQSCGMMFIDLLDGCCYGDQNTLSRVMVKKGVPDDDDADDE